MTNITDIDRSSGNVPATDRPRLLATIGTRGRRLGRRAAASLLLLLLLAAAPLACGDGEVAPGEATTTTAAQLFTPPGATLWNGNVIGTGASIDVCFAVRPRLEANGNVDCAHQSDATKDCSGRTATVDGTMGFSPSTLRTIVQQQVSSTWERYGNLTFNWKGDCPIDGSINMHRNSDLAGKILIQFRQSGTVTPNTSCTTDLQCEDQFPNSFCNKPSGSSTGTCKNFDAVDVTLNLGPSTGFPTVIQFNWPPVQIGVDNFNVIHEFGHALGFAHEWTRNDYVDPAAAAWRAAHGNCTTDASCNVAGAPGGVCRLSGTAAGLCLCSDRPDEDTVQPQFKFTPAPGDPSSIMDYSCHATSAADLSAQDRLGIRAAYGNKAIGGSAGHQLTYFFCASENDTCVLGGSKYVAFGANGRFFYKALSGNVACTRDTFGGDPAAGVIKSCYLANYAFKLNEGASGAAGVGARDIAFGAGGFFNFRTVGANYTCDRTTFGDPLPGVVKACYSALPGFFPSSTNNLTNLNKTPVAWGANGNFIFKLLSGSATCNMSTFGFDPAVNIPKSCYLPSFGGFVADENQSYNFGGPAAVVYGSGTNGNFLSGSQASASCSNATFGGDPDPSQQKHCYGALLP